jgi:hypothetical protein
MCKLMRTALCMWPIAHRRAGHGRRSARSICRLNQVRCSCPRYPRTRHIEGSGIQAGDDDLQVAQWSELAGKHLVVEEKIDGANCGISFDRAGRLWLQSRGHYLAGGRASGSSSC